MPLASGGRSADVVGPADVADVCLVGTGLAPLVAASYFAAQGKSVLVLNPDRDFFLEDSELPFDPFWPVSGKVLSPERFARNSPERALAELRPDFPGAVEHWSGSGGEPPRSAGFHDKLAPHVRSRARLWITGSESPRHWDWGVIEDAYVETADAGLKPQILEGLQAARRFPGFSSGAVEFRGLCLSKFCDVDVQRYRHGLLEFVRERLGPERVVCRAVQVELMPGGVRYHAGGLPRTARLHEGMLVFWTPRLSQWVLAQAKRAEVSPRCPVGVRLWEQWSLISREPLDLGVIGCFEDMSVWAEIEGAPLENTPLHSIAALRAGPLVNFDALQFREGGSAWASTDSFDSLTSLFSGFLGWERFSVRSMRPRAIFEWAEDKPWTIADVDPRVKVVPACDGPLLDVVRRTRLACDQLIRAIETASAEEREEHC
jgi:hypothetical protein